MLRLQIGGAIGGKILLLEDYYIMICAPFWLCRGTVKIDEQEGIGRTATFESNIFYSSLSTGCLRPCYKIVGFISALTRHSFSG